jgi:hypothetical protein
MTEQRLYASMNKLIPMLSQERDWVRRVVGIPLLEERLRNEAGGIRPQSTVTGNIPAKEVAA